ncbi:hypothetical protein Tco_0776966 [Tanacetum coccineum]
MDKCDSMSTPMATARLDANLQGTPTDQTKYHSIDRGLMYLTASRPDIAFATFVCAHCQARPTVKHLKEEHVERGTVKLYFVGTEYQLADLFTKAPSKERFKYLVHRIEFIMAQLQQRDVPKDQFCPPNKRFDLMDANKKFDLVNPQCPNESKILADILNNHPLRPCVAASALVVLFYRNALGFSLTLRSPSNFMSKGLPQPWQTLCKIFARCLTTRVIGYDQPPVELYYSLTHLTSLIPYPRFTKIIINHYMIEHPDIYRRVHDNYHIDENDDLVKNIFSSRKNKEGIGLKIPNLMLTDEMKLTAHYQMYIAVFRVDVPTTQSQPIESIQRTHRTTSTPRIPNPEVTKGESSDQRKSTIIRLRVPPRRQDLETPIPTAAEINITNLAKTI